jgi:hypothetical protein
MTAAMRERLRASRALLPYCYPRLSAVDFAAAHRQPLHIQIVRFAGLKAR